MYLQYSSYPFHLTHTAMRNLPTLLLALVAIPLTGMAADTTFVDSTIDKVTLYFNGAVVERKAKVKLPAGKHVLVLHGLTSQLDPQSVNVGTALPLDILSIQHQVLKAAGTTFESLRRNSRVAEADRLRIKAIEDSVKSIQDAGKSIDNELAVLALEEGMLNENSTLVDKKNGTTLKEIAETAAFLRQRLTSIRTDRQKLLRQRDDLEVQLSRLNFALNEALHPIKAARSEVVLQALAEEAVTGELTLRYFVGSAAWTPGYDFKVESVAKPMEILYKATVIQTTGEDWKEVELVLSTANPALPNELPQRKRWLVTGRFPYTPESVKPIQGQKSGTVSGEIVDSQTGEPLPFVSLKLMKDGKTVGSTSSDLDGRYRIGPIASGTYEIEASLVGYTSKRMTNVQVTGNRISFANMKLHTEVALECAEVVTYHAPLISREGGASGGVIQRDDIRTRGSRSDDQWIYIDGIKVKGSSQLPQSQAQAAPGSSMTPQQRQEMVYRELNSRAQMFENLGSTEYTLKSRHTLPSDGRDHALKIREVSVDATYEHRVLPIATTEVYLSARVADWSALNLSAGTANVYFGNVYTGQVSIDPIAFDDTLKIALGRDPGIHCKRELNRTLTGKQALATGVKETVAYTITVRNTTGNSVSLVIEDQYPISPYKQYPTTLESAVGAEVDEHSGFLTWITELQSNETQSFDFTYNVKSPR